MMYALKYTVPGYSTTEMQGNDERLRIRLPSRKSSI